MIERDPLAASEPDYALRRRHVDRILGRAVLESRSERGLDDAVVRSDHKQLAALRASFGEGASEARDNRSRRGEPETLS